MAISRAYTIRPFINLPGYPPSHPPAYPFGYPPGYLPGYPAGYPPDHLPSYPLGYLPSYSPGYPPSYLPSYPPGYPLDYPPGYPPGYLLVIHPVILPVIGTVIWCFPIFIKLSDGDLQCKLIWTFYARKKICYVIFSPLSLIKINPFRGKVLIRQQQWRVKWKPFHDSNSQEHAVSLFRVE